MITNVGLALKVCEDMEMGDKASQRIGMRFCKIDSPEKIRMIVEEAKKFYWWQTTLITPVSARQNC
jgi:hypothetical protein